MVWSVSPGATGTGQLNCHLLRRGTKNGAHIYKYCLRVPIQISPCTFGELNCNEKSFWVCFCCVEWFNQMRNTGCVSLRGTCTFWTMPSGTLVHWAEELVTLFPSPLPSNHHWNLQTTKGYIRFIFPISLKTKICPRSSVALGQFPYLSVLIAFSLRSIDHVYFYTAH